MALFRTLLLAILLCPAARADDRMVVHIACSDGSQGSGVTISAEGHVLTAWHVVQDAETCTATIGDKSSDPVPIDLLYRVRGLDGAVMQIDRATPHFATYCPMDTHLKEARVIAKGFHAGSRTDPHVTEGIISSADTSDGFLDTDVAMNRGQSGGPVFLKHSTALIGIVAGARFDAIGQVQSYRAIPADALARSARLQRARDCAPQVKIFSLSEHETRLNRKIAETRSEYERLIDQITRASDAQKGELRARLALSQQRLEALLADRADLQTSYDARVEDLRLLRLELDKLRGGNVSDARLAEAQQALYEGDTDRARQAFEKIRTAEAQAVTRLAAAEFGLGKIADDEIRWHDAYAHFETAARLDPTYDHLYQATNLAIKAGAYDNAVARGAQLVAAARSEFGTQSDEFLGALNRYAASLETAGQFDLAVTLQRQALAISERAFGTNHPNHAVGLNNLAGVLTKTGRFEEAESLYRIALDIGARTKGTDHLDHAMRLNNLGTLLQKLGRYDEAELLFRQALEIGATTLGTSHPDYAIGLNNLAILLRTAGKINESERLFRQTLEIIANSLGTDHPNYAIGLNGLAGLLWVTDRVGEAEPLYRQALDIGANSLGTRHPDYANWLNNLALLLGDTGRHDEAEPLYRQSLEISSKVIGTSHPDYAIRLNNLALTLEGTGRLEEAEPLYRQALEILNQKLGSDHPHTKTVGRNLQSLLVLMGKE